MISSHICLMNFAISKQERVFKQGLSGLLREIPAMLSRFAKVFPNCGSITVPAIGCILNSVGVS
jgi:hypothetical protein